VPTIFERLRSQREALGLSQQALAEICGITARSQRNYESGERLPDAAYLAALSAAGADVLYILTGQRSQPIAPLLDNYRNAPAGVQSGVKTTLGAFAPGIGAATAKKRRA
jgi:transcriptional regulator with XRE-family HTH domain